MFLLIRCVGRISAWHHPCWQVFNVLANGARCGDPKLSPVLHDVVDDASELAKPIGLPQNKAMQHDGHDQRSACRLFKHFIKLIDEILTIKL